MAYPPDRDREQQGRGERRYGRESGYGRERSGYGPHDYERESDRRRFEQRPRRFDDEGGGFEDQERFYDLPRGGGEYEDDERISGSQQGAPWRPLEDWQQPRQLRKVGERGQTGRFAGRGPKNYQRSDARIQEDVCDRLTADGQIDASEIEVSVKDGEVTLTGSVDERGMKRAAEDCVDAVSGVRQVHNRLRIGRATAETGESGRGGAREM
jgi:hypothetical protein